MIVPRILDLVHCLFVYAHTLKNTFSLILNPKNYECQDKFEIGMLE